MPDPPTAITIETDDVEPAAKSSIRICAVLRSAVCSFSLENKKGGRRYSLPCFIVSALRVARATIRAHDGQTAVL